MSVCSSHGPAALAVGDQPLQMSSTDAPCALSFSSVSLSLLTSLSSHGPKAAGTSAPRASSCAPAHLSHAASRDSSALTRCCSGKPPATEAQATANPWMSTPAAFRPCRLKPDLAGSALPLLLFFLLGHRRPGYFRLGEPSIRSDRPCPIQPRRPVGTAIPSLAMAAGLPVARCEYLPRS